MQKQYLNFFFNCLNFPKLGIPLNCSFYNISKLIFNERKFKIFRYAFNTKCWHYTSHWQKSHLLQWKCDLAQREGLCVHVYLNKRAFITTNYFICFLIEPTDFSSLCTDGLQLLFSILFLILTQDR